MAKKYWWEEDDQQEKEPQGNVQVGTQESKTQGYWWQENDQQSKTQQTNGKSYWWDNGSISNTVGTNIVNSVNSWLDSHNSYVKSYQDRYANRKGNYEDAYVSDSADWYDSVRKQKVHSDMEAAKILAYMDQYADYLDADWMKEVRNTLTQAQQGHSQILSIASKDNEYWNSWANEEMVSEYGSAEEAYKYYQLNDTYGKMSFDELWNAANTLGDGKEKDLVYSHITAGMTADDYAAQTDRINADIAIAKELRSKYYHIWYENEDGTKRLGPLRTQEELDAKIAATQELFQKYGLEYDPENPIDDAYLSSEIEALENEQKQLNSYWVQAQKTQELIRFNSVGDPTSELYDPKFQEYVSLGTAIDYKAFGEGKYNHAGRGTAVYTMDKYRAAAIALAAHNGQTNLPGMGNEMLNIYQKMNENEFNILAYYLAKDQEQGTDLAKQYVDRIEETLKGRRYTDVGNAIGEIPVIRELYGIYAGLDQFATGLYNATLNSGKDYYAPTSTQITSAAVREKMGDVDLKWYNFATGEWNDAKIFGSSLGQVGYDLINTTANMAPSILASYAVGKINPAAGAALGNTLMGTSAAGHAYTDAINRGFGQNEARFYGAAIGASEALLQHALGGIGNLGGASGKIANAVSGIDKGILRFAAQYGGKMLSEGIEEGLQEILDPIFQNAILGTDENINWEEVAYSALLGALSAGVLEGPGTIQQTRVEQNLKKQYGGNTNALIQEGLGYDVDSESYKYATEYKAKTDAGKSLTGAEIRNILAANQEQITTKDIEKIKSAAAQRLTNLGETKDVATIAELATKRALGQRLTRAEKSQLARSQYGAQVAKELLPESIDVEDIDTSWAEDIGTEIVNYKAYNKTARELLNKITESLLYKPLEKRMEGEKPANVSDTGKAVIRATGEEIDLTNPKIKSITKDDVVLNVNGKDVDTKEIDFATDEQWYAFNAIKKIEHITPGVANSMIANLDMTKPIGPQLNGMDEAFSYGIYKYSEADLKAGLFAGELTDELRNKMYNLGRYVAKNTVADNKAAIKKMRTAADEIAEKAAAEGKEVPKSKDLTITYNHGGGVVEKLDTAEKKLRKEMSKEQRGGVEVAKLLHMMGIGTDFELFASKTVTDEDGNPVEVYVDDDGQEQAAYAGVYLAADGKIRINLNAYSGTNGLVLNALAHELTHFIKSWSPEKYVTMAEFLTDTYGETGMNMHQRVLREQARLKGIRGKDVSYEEAYDEVVANALNRMFDDGKVLERLNELAAKDRGLVEKILSGIKQFLKKFLNVYQKNQSLFRDTRDLMEMKEAFEKLQEMFADALVDASENFQASRITATEGKTLADFGVGFDENTRSVYSLQFSTAYKDSIQVGKKSFDTEAIAQIVAKGTGRSIEDARKWVKSEMAIANIVMQNPEFLDFEADNRYEAIKKNSDYPQGTVDLSNLCPKREEFTAMFDMLQKKYPNKLFTAQDVADMRKILSDNDITVACGACFVEDRRQLIGEIADTFINMWKEAVDTGKPLQKTNAAGNKVELLVTKALAKQYGLTSGAKIMATDTYIPNQYDLTTYEGFKLLEKNHPTIAMAFNRYNNSRGQQAARLIEGRAEYNRQILGWSDAKVRSVNNNGGLRIFSFSDFEVVHLLDLVQVIIDCAAKGVKIQGYTKIPAFAKLVRGTGIKLNRSLIPKGDHGFHIENGKVVLDYDTTEGIDINDDNFIDESDNPDVGNIVIGINPTQIGAAMLDSFIDYIIPFHSNKAKEILKKLGTGEWVNYKESQHERDISTGKASKHNVNIYTEVINKYHPTNKVEFVDAFLKECKRQGKIPRYAEFLNVDGNGDYAYREGYHKLLVDFKMFDAEGNILPQGNITPSLDENFMKELLNAEIDRKQNYKFPKEVYADIDKQFGSQYSSQETDLDSDGNQLSKEQQEYFADSKARDKKGNLLIVYHGTTANFNVFKKGDVGFHFGTKGAARGRAGYGKNVNLKAVYLNITNPIVFDEDLGSWDADYRLTKELYDRGILSREEAVAVLRTDDGMYKRSTEAANKKLAAVLMEKGYDGIAYQNTFETKKATTSYIAFSSNQAKEITNLNPTSNPDIRYSSQQTDLDMETDYAYDGGKKETKQEDRTNVTRKETREAFYRRAHEKVFTVRERGQVACGYNPVANKTRSARQAERNLKKLGIQVIVHDGLEVNVNGITRVILGDATSVAGDAVYVRNSMRTDPMETAGHEAFHFWKYTDAREMYNETVADNIIFASDAFAQFQKEIADAYFGEEIGIEDDGADKLAEEIFAYITGLIHAGDSKNIVRPFMRDYDAVKASWDDLINKQTARKANNRYSSQQTDFDSNGKQLGDDQLEYFENSMARNRKGNLQVVYHGGTVEFEFDTLRGGNGATQYGPGAYFTDSEYYAKEYTWYRGGNVKAYYLNIEKMFDDTNMDATVKMPQWKKLEQILRTNGIEDKFINGFANNGFAYMSRYLGNKAGSTRSDSWGGSEMLNGMLREAGFDGIKGTLNDMYQYVIFTPNQAKLTTNEVPSTFYDTRYSTQQTDNLTDRDMLANAFETISKNSEEYEMIQDYKSNVKLLNKLERDLDEVKQEIRDIRFGTGKYDAERLKLLEGKADRLAKDITKYDKRLLNMEASAPLRKVIQQERKKAEQKTKAHVQEIQQNKKLRAEQTELRHKIRKTIRDLDKILNRGNKKMNVKEDMKGFVSKALELADYLFTDHISNDDLIRRGITVRMTPKEAALVKETEDILAQLYDNFGSLTAEEYTKLDAKRKSNMDKLRDLLTAQRNEGLKTPVYNLFNDLVTEYANLQYSKQDAVKAAYDSNVERFLRNYMGEEDGQTNTDRKTLLQNMRVADMTTKELDNLYYAYKMVLHSVREANKLHIEGKTETIEQMAGRIMGDFTKRKIPDKKVAIALQKLTNKIGWDYEKLHYALDRIGSEAFTELVMNLANSENIVMQDIIEAAAFRDEIVENYGFNNWDVNKEIDREFLDNTGKKFKLTLGQLMALYAYSRRDGAWDHIEYGGFVFGEAALTNPKPADSYKLNKAQCEAITNLLTKEQKGYVEAMQKFLSETMGAKGNDVSMMLYGIKMFGEKNYFPIHIAGQFKAQASESQAKAAAGFSSMSNAGFTHAQNPNAKAPFVLEGFNEVWADHVNEMSRYHGTVPALEDMRKVMNRSFYSEAGTDSIALKQMMENAFGKEAVDYFDNLYKEANSGAIRDILEKDSHKFLSLFRKNSVAYSLSVLIQQPASMVRAYALIDKKYFGFKGFGTISSGIAKAVSDKWTKAHTNAYNEMLKYAPGVTMAKEIGGFDTATGGSIRSYLLDTRNNLKWYKRLAQGWKTGTVAEKGKAVMDLVDNNEVANLPNLADKIAWIEIWNACKREAVAKNKNLAPNSEEFMQAVGERFTEVIRATQVYDSIFAKSPMLKSKRVWVQMAVSFMNEPNTVANMAESAVRNTVRGNWKGGLRKSAVLIHSIIFTGVLKSIIYAMRDDDEDETYIEKYIEALTGSLMDDFNALNYIPLARDAWSVAQGYDVERADMAIVSDAVNALNAVIKNATTQAEDMTEEQLIEFDKKVTEANWELVGSLASFFGIPVKNIRRDIKGVIDHAKIASSNAGKTTNLSVLDKVYDAIIESIPFMKNERTKVDKLYDAIISGDQTYLDRLKSTYKTEDAYQNAVRKALRENDPRIHAAAQARYEGRTEEYKRIFREIKDEGKFNFDDIMSAINSEETKIRTGVEPDKATSSYSASSFVEAIVAGNRSDANAMKSDIISVHMANGKTKEEAEKEFTSAVGSAIGDAYSAGLLSDAEAKKMLQEYAGKDEEEATSRVNWWVFCEKYPKYKDIFTESHVEKYNDFGKPAGISVDVYAKFITGTKGLGTIRDEWGEIVKSKREQVLEVIDSLPLTWQQKDALYLAAGYSESNIWDVPW